MAYQSWSVSFGEQPSAAKWNILGTNDASFNDGSGLNAISSPITAASGNHLVLQAASGKTVKGSVLRQDDTTNTYHVGDTVTLTGWGVSVPGAVISFDETVTFGVTFTQRPIVIITPGGDHASATTYGSGGATVKIFIAEAHTITTTTFVANCSTRDGTSWSAGNAVFYQWIAIGEI